MAAKNQFKIIGKYVSDNVAVVQIELRTGPLYRMVSVAAAGSVTVLWRYLELSSAVTSGSAGRRHKVVGGG